MKKIFIVFVSAFVLLVTPTSAYADFNIIQGPCNPTDSAKAAASSPTCQQNKDQNSDPNNSDPVSGPKGSLQTTANIMALLTGIVAVGMIISAGISLITAGGNIAGQRAGDNPSKAKKARAQISAAVIGLIIVALSWTILSFIIQKFVK